MIGFGLTNKREVLELIELRTKEKKETTYREVEAELGLSADAACSHLKRLWQARLIKSTEHPGEYREARELRVAVRDTRFRVTRRGIQRLEHWRRLDGKGTWPL